jgi:hypothetical protein
MQIEGDHLLVDPINVNMRDEKGISSDVEVKEVRYSRDEMKSQYLMYKELDKVFLKIPLSSLQHTCFNELFLNSSRIDNVPLT